jgi:hypothetical protein
MDHEKDGPIKAKAQASGTKQMVVTFFDQQVMMFFNSVHLATIVIAPYIVMIQTIFVKQLKWTRMATGQWFLHWDNALEQIGTGSQDHRHLSVHRRLSPMAKAKQNACLHR